MGYLLVIGTVAILIFYFAERHLGPGSKEPRLTGWTMRVAQGRPYGDLTPDKVRALRAEGYEVRVSDRSDRYSLITVPAETLRGAIMAAGEIGRKHHLMLLWD